jgi:tetratricopeptide (TPR) repeat protein
MNKNIISIILIAILGFSVYFNSLGGKFIWDDRYLVRDNPYIKSFSNIGDVFTKDIGAGAGIKSNSYRPLQLVTYMLDYAFWGLDVRGYHLTNVLLHIFTALCLYWLLNIFLKDNLVSLFAASLFVIHPIHTEAVSYISGRADSLAALFMLLCFIFYVKNGRSFIFMVLSFAAALLSRENSLILPVLLLVYHYAFREKVNVKSFLSLLSMTGLFLLLRLVFLKPLAPDILASTTAWQRLPGFFVALTNYTRLLFLPFNLHMEYGDKLFSFKQPGAIIGMVILLALLSYVIKKRESRGIVFFSLIWFFIALLPSSNLFPINAYMAEHWLYLPSMGFFSIAAIGLGYLYKTKRFRVVSVVVIIGIIVFYSIITIKQNNYWKEPIAFFKRTVKYNPGSARAFNDFGIAYREAGREEEAIRAFRKTIEINPQHADAYSNLANLYNSLGEKEEAIALFEKAIEINPYYTQAYNNLGNVYGSMGEYDQAIELYNKALTIDPEFAQVYSNLAAAYFKKGEYRVAFQYYDRAEELGCVNPELRKLLEPYHK